MRKWFALLFISNIALVGSYVLSSKASWEEMCNDLKPVEWVCAQHGGVLYNVTVHFKNDLFTRAIAIKGWYEENGNYLYPRAGVHYNQNLPLMLFLITVGINLILAFKIQTNKT